MTSFRGISLDQDPRFKDKQSALLAKTSFPPSFNTKVDVRKVEMAVMKPWITKKVIELLGFEDDVLLEYIFSLLEDNENPVVDGKQMQLLLTGFLESKTAPFMTALWDLLLSAQSNPLRVPTALLEEKKREMRAREEQEALRRRGEEHMDEVRQREGEGRGGPGGGRGGRGGFGGGGPPGRGGHGGGGRFDDRDRDGGYGARGGRGGFGGERDMGYGPRGGGGGGGRGGYRDEGFRGGGGGGRVPSSRPVPLTHPSRPVPPSPLLLPLPLSFPLAASTPARPLAVALAQPLTWPQQAARRAQPQPEPQSPAAQEAVAEPRPEQEQESLATPAAAELARRESELKEGLLRKKAEASRSTRP
ncbi:hypothetical protein JCM10450v2_003884 [Rhodotorula kratochvilovae]